MLCLLRSVKELDRIFICPRSLILNIAIFLIFELGARGRSDGEDSGSEAKIVEDVRTSCRHS